MCAPVIPVTGKNDFPFIRGEHRESVKTLVPAYFFNIAAVGIHRIHVERKPSFVLMIAAENDTAIRQKVGCPVCLAKAGNLFGITAIRIRNKNFHTRGRD